MTELYLILLDMTICLLLTLSAEGILILLIFRKPKPVWYSMICNLLTNPALNLIMLLCAPLVSGSRAAGLGLLALLETAAVVAEGFIYRTLLRLDTLRAMLLSLLLNAASFALGVMLLW